MIGWKNNGWEVVITMEVKVKYMRYIVASIIVLLIIGLSYTSYLGKKQDEKFESNETTYNKALQYMEQGEFTKALPLLKRVEKEQYDSMIVKYNIGIALANTGNWDRAIQEFQNSLDLNPYKVEEPVFMMQFATLLINEGKYDEAKKVLERCKTLPAPEQIPDYKDRLNAMIKFISQDHDKEGN